MTIVDFPSANIELESSVLKQIDCDILICPNTQRETILACVKNADAVLVNRETIDKELIDSMENCKIIARYGTGYDNVDITAATAKGIVVANVPGYCTVEVAEHAAALLLACARDVTNDRDTALNEPWGVTPKREMKRIAGTVLGIAGFGNTGKSLARILGGFGFSRILVFSRSTQQSDLPPNGELVDFDTLLRESDYISLHLPLTKDTASLFDKASFDKMKDDSVLINTARGKIIDEAALSDAIQSGKIRAAGLDVLCDEPPKADNPLLGLPGVIVTNHKAYYGKEAADDLCIKSAENVVAMFKAGNPIYRVVE